MPCLGAPVRLYRRFGFKDPVKNMQNLLAYIDPASGTLLLQALIAAGIGGIAFFRRSIWGFLSMFSRRGSAPTTSENDVVDPPA